MPDSNTVNSILRAAEIMRVLSEGAERIKDITARTGLSNSTVHRLLMSLKKAGFVGQDPATRTYHLGAFIHQLGSNPLVAHKSLIAASVGEMQRLATKSRETVTLSVPLTTERICLEEIESPESLKYTAGKASIAPLYAGAAGKVLLAAMNETQLQAVLQAMRFMSLQENTPVDKTTLVEQINKVRELGYATSLSERIADCASISAKVSNYVTPVALSVLGPESRFGPKMTALLDELKKSAEIISMNLTQDSN